MGLTDEQLFEIAAKLHNLSLADLRLKKRYLDAVVIETKDGAKYTHPVAELEEMAAGGKRDLLAEPRPAKPQHTRKR